MSVWRFGLDMVGPAIPQWQFQVAMLLGVLSFAFAWQRAMRHISGYMPLGPAYKALIWGFITGGLSAVAFDRLAFAPLVDATITGNFFSWQMLLSSIVLLAAAESSLILWIIARAERKGKGSAATAGHAYGIGAGAMLGSYLAIRIFDPALGAAGAITSGFNLTSLVFIGLISFCACTGLGSIGSYQGVRLLTGRRVRPLIETSLMRSFIRTGLIFGVFAPILLLPLLPTLILLESRARSNWLQSGLTPLAKRLKRRAARGKPVVANLSSNRDLAEE